MAAFLFARALNRTAEFKLVSNVGGAGAFDDLVFRYRVRNTNVWKTCFIQLNHKDKGGSIQRCSLTQMSGKFSLLKYFQSFCEIEKNTATDPNLKECGPFIDFEFVIYTNRKMKNNSPLQGGDSDPVSILSSGTYCGKYIAFDENIDKDIFVFFEELSHYHKLITEIDSLLKGGTSVEEVINLKIKNFLRSIRNKDIKSRLTRLKSNLKNEDVTGLIEEVSKCNFTLFREFLSKVKIFQSQANEKSLKGLIEKELQEACKASPSVVNFIYTQFEEDFSKWWKRDRKLLWLNENSDLWHAVEECITPEIKKISEFEIQETGECGIQFNEQYIRKLSGAIEQNTVLKIVTNSNICNLQKLKTYQALKKLNYKNSLFIGIEPLVNKSEKIQKLWPCKWWDVLIVDCGSDINVAHRVLDIFHQSADNNTAGRFVDNLQRYQQKLILIFTRQIASGFQEKLRNISYFQDNCSFSELDKKSQEQILERPVNFQGPKVTLSTLVGTDPPDSMKDLLNSDVISILLSNEHELSFGRQLGDHCKYYVPRVLQHHIYVKEDILKLTDNAITFAVSGLQADELKKYLPPGEKIFVLVYDEKERSYHFKIFSDFFKSGFSAEMENKKVDIEAGQNIIPEEVRYIILGNKNLENEFGELKKLCRNVHWIHVEEGSFLWRDTNGNINVIRRYIDNTKCKKCDDMNSVIEHNDRTMLLVAEPGMGKSTFLSYMVHKIKEWNPSVWVLRINLIEHTKELERIEFEEECIDKCKEFLWSIAHSPEQDDYDLHITKQIFLQALKETGQMVIILDGFDEISPDYSRQVEMLVRTLRDKTASKIWISSRFSYRQELEDMLGKFAFTLQPFTPKNRVQFLKQYWSEVCGISNRENLQKFADKLLSLCSQNLTNKDGDFAGIPLQTMMLGEAFANSAKEYCSSGKFNLPEKFNLLSLFKMFWKKKCSIYFWEKNKMDSSNPTVNNIKKSSLEIHMISALKYLFSQNELNQIHEKIYFSDMEQAMKLKMQIVKAEDFGIITELADGKLHFIHRCFAEYFAAKWFTDNYENCEEFISKTLFKSNNEVTQNLFDRMLAKGFEIHVFVVSNDIQALNDILQKETNINTLDKGGRTALHLAASYNRPCIQQLLSFPGIDVNKPDSVLKWTPLRYADRMKSWMAMDILLQNGANPDDIVFTRPNGESQEWVQRALWECASKGHIKLLEFMLKCGIEVNASLEVPDILHDKFTLLHRASYCGQVEVVRLIVNRGADINIRAANNNNITALHLAAESGSVDIINFLLNKEMSVNLTNTNDSTPLHVSAKFGKLEATKTLVERGAAIDNTNKSGVTALMVAAYFAKLEIFCYLTETGADINIRNNKYINTALHYAAGSGSVDIIQLLLDKEMSVNLPNKDGFTPLHVCAKSGHLDATKCLVEKGAAVNKTNKDGTTPLMVAAQYGKVEIFRHLTEIDADINIRNAFNNTALDYAYESGSVDIIKLLLDKGMSVNLNNTNDLTLQPFFGQFVNEENSS
jgi:ankyrin repeat protein